MSRMSTPFRDLAQLATCSLAIHRSLAERQALRQMVTNLLAAIGQPALDRLVVSVQRDNPVTGIRGTVLLLVVAHHAAQSRMRLFLPSLTEKVKLEPMGFQSVRIRVGMPDALSMAPTPGRTLSPRPRPPEQARQRLRAFYCQDH
ncbi:MAG: hypothetical protein ACO3WO_04670 [Burkholderiaceae bacterium]